MKIKLADALLRRKELQAKVDQLRPINNKDLYEIKAQRKNVTDSVDDIIVQVPIVSIGEVTRAYDYHAKRLRLVDGAIQQANWTAEIDVDESVMADYEPPEKISR